MKEERKRFVMNENEDEKNIFKTIQMITNDITNDF